MKASSLSFRLAVSFLLIGISMGIGMGILNDHSIMPAHAHVNLLGWVSLFLFGFYYERRPELDASRAALVQACIWSLGTALLVTAITASHLGYTGFFPMASLGTAMVLAGTLMFMYFVFRPGIAVSPGPGLGLTPAE